MVVQHRSRASSPAPKECQNLTDEHFAAQLGGGKGVGSEVPMNPGTSGGGPGPARTSGLQKLLNAYIGPLMLLVPCPLLCAVLAFVTCSKEVAGPTVSDLLSYGSVRGAPGTLVDAVEFIGIGSWNSWVFLTAFNILSLVLYWWPGVTKFGPITPTGHTPEYVENGVAHCLFFTTAFIAGAFLLGLYDLGIMYDLFPEIVGALNVFGLVLCLILYAKGLYFPSTADSGTSGQGFIFDYYWGTELYPRICKVDVKKFINCRFSMTFWMLAGISFAYRSYTLHDRIDPGIVLSALSQFLYLCKFYAWEIGYMRSIDIIVDRAGFYETWGCLVWVPSVYTLHTRILVRSPSGLSWLGALAIFGLGLGGVLLNYAADWQRMHFREKKGECLIWGRKPEFIRAKYTATNAATGTVETHEALLLASGWWGIARHFQYSFELVAAWSWGMLGGVSINGFLPLFYPTFLTILLVHRARRDEEKCLDKYGEHYKQYMKRVQYRIIPFIF